MDREYFNSTSAEELYHAIHSVTDGTIKVYLPETNQRVVVKSQCVDWESLVGWADRDTKDGLVGNMAYYFLVWIDNEKKVVPGKNDFLTYTDMATAGVLINLEKRFDYRFGGLARVAPWALVHAIQDATDLLHREQGHTTFVRH